MKILEKINEFLADEIGDFMPRVFNGRFSDNDVVDRCPQCKTMSLIKSKLLNPAEDEDPFKNVKQKRKKLIFNKKARLDMEKETI